MYFVGMYESMLDSISAYEFNYAWCAPAIPVVHQSKHKIKQKNKWSFVTRTCFMQNYRRQYADESSLHA